MKKINYFVIILLSFASLLSCEEDNLLIETELNPELYISLPENAPSIAFPNKEISFSAEAFAKAGISRIETKVDFRSISGTILVPNEDTNTISYPFSYIPTNGDLGKILRYVIVVQDKNGFTSTTTYSVEIILEPAIIEFEFPKMLPDSLNIGDTLEFEIQITSEDDLEKIETIYNNAELSGLTITNFSNPFATSYQFSYEIQPEDGGQDITFTFRATDLEGKFKEETFTLFIEGKVYPKVLDRYSNVTLGMQGNTDIGPYLDLKTNTIYTVPNAKLMSPAIDIGAFRSGSSGINLFAPSYGAAAQFIYNAANWGDDNLGSWAVRNASELRRISSDLMSTDDFNNITDDRLVIEVFEKSEPSFDGLNRTAEGEIIAFKTADGTYGVILIKSLESTSSGSITFDYKIQGDEFIIPIDAYSDVSMGLQGNVDIGQFMDLNTNTVYSVPDAKINSAEIDLGVFRSASSSGINLFAPSYENAAQFIYNAANWGDDKMGSWPARNQTELREVSGSNLTINEFNEIVDGQDIISVFDQSGTSFDDLTQVADGKIIAFKTADSSKYGLILVKSIVSSSSGNIVFDYKIQQ
jgi:hypothetical protein